MTETKEQDLLLSVLIPCRNEAANIPRTVTDIVRALDSKKIPFEIVIVDDHSEDETEKVVGELQSADRRIRCIKNDYPAGFGFGIRKGLDAYAGDAVAIVMADRSDSPQDLVKYYEKLREGYDCVFGTRFCSEAKVTNYPAHKLFLNRLGNLFIRIMFWLPYNDVSNAFKCYRRTAVDGMRPFVSCHFNITVEMPLKAIARGYSWCVVPTDWYGREKGISKWKVRELGSRYLFTLFYIWLEKTLARTDYVKGRYWLGEEGGKPQ